MTEDDSSRKEETKKKEELLNKLLNKSTTIISFSVRPKDFCVLEDFERITKTEKGPRGRSDLIVQALKEFNIRHGRGNPQLKIAHYIEVEPSPNNVFCHYLHGRDHDGKVFCSNPKVVKNPVVYGNIDGEWVNGVTCYSCKFNKLRRGDKMNV
jgi:hypothetical protein